MSSVPNLAGTLDVRSSGLLTEYVNTHHPCAPGAEQHARRRWAEQHSRRKRLKLAHSRAGSGDEEDPRSPRNPSHIVDKTKHSSERRERRNRAYGSDYISYDNSTRTKAPYWLDGNWTDEVFSGKRAFGLGGGGGSEGERLGFYSSCASCAHRSLSRYRHGSRVGSCLGRNYNDTKPRGGGSTSFGGGGPYGGYSSQYTNTHHYNNKGTQEDFYESRNAFENRRNGDNGPRRMRSGGTRRGPPKSDTNGLNGAPSVSTNGYGHYGESSFKNPSLTRSARTERSYQGQGQGSPYKGSNQIKSNNSRRGQPHSEWHNEGGASGDVAAGGVNDEDDDEDDSSEEDEEDDPKKFDRPRDWATCFGAFIVIGAILGVVQSFAVFAPAIQHQYQCGVLEAVLVGCLSYFSLLIFLPLATSIKLFFGYQWTAMAGMMLFFIGLIMDSFVLNIWTLYFSHVFLLGFGGSLAYAPAMTICSHHFRRRLDFALTLISCAGSIGTLTVYVLSNLMLDFISYRWAKLCMAVVILVCSGACQSFPNRNRKYYLKQDRIRLRLKRCMRRYVRERDANFATKLDPQDVPKKSFVCVCVCDVSLWMDHSFLVWAMISMVAVMTVYVPYLFLVAYAYTVGTQYAVGVVASFCLASVVGRAACMNFKNHTFLFNRTLFQVCCAGSGGLYIFLNWADTLGLIITWSIAVGILEGASCVVIPRITLQTVPTVALDQCCKWIGILHAVAIVIGPMTLMSVYYSTLEYAPALFAIGVVQIIAGVLAFLLPDQERDEYEDLVAKVLNETGDPTEE